MGVPDHESIARAVDAAEGERAVEAVQRLSENLRPVRRTGVKIGVLFQIMRDDLEDQIAVRAALRMVSQAQELFEEFVRAREVEIAREQKRPAQAVRIVHERVAGGFLVPSVRRIAQMSQQEPAVESRRPGAPSEQIGQRVFRGGGTFHTVGRQTGFRVEIQ